jgi:hypothetical protein
LQGSGCGLPEVLSQHLGAQIEETHPRRGSFPFEMEYLFISRIISVLFLVKGVFLLIGIVIMVKKFLAIAFVNLKSKFHSELSRLVARKRFL